MANPTILDAYSETINGIPTTQTISAGSDRRAFVAVFLSHFSEAVGHTSVDNGDQSMTLLVEAELAASDVCVQIWELKETAAAARVGTGLTFNGGTFTAQSYVTFSIQDADQSTETTNSESVNAGSGTLSLVRATDSFTFAASLFDSPSDPMVLTNPADVGDFLMVNGSVGYGNQADTSNTSDVTWSHGGARDNAIVGFNFAVSAASATVTQADTTPEDGVLQSFTTTGLTGTITAASLGGKDILASLSNTDPTDATTYTLDVSATESSVGQPRIGETSTLSVTATGGTATQDVVIGVATGWAVVTLAGTLDKTANGFLATLDSDLSVTSAVGDIIYYSTARGEVITATGVYTGGTTIAFQSTEFVFQDVTGASATVTALSEGGAFFPFGTGPVLDAPTLASTLALAGTVDLAFSSTLAQTGGDTATSWTITGGADQAQYSLTNAGVFTRDVPNPTEEAEVVTVTATNSGGTSGTQTITITYTEAGEGSTVKSINLSSIRIGI